MENEEISKMIDVGKNGISDRSQGGEGAFNAVLEPGNGNLYKITIPVLVLAGTKAAFFGQDALIAPAALDLIHRTAYFSFPDETIPRE